MYIVSIPKISTEELMKRYQNIKPIVEVDGVKHWLREYYSLYSLKEVSYIWRSKDDKRKPVDMSTLTAEPMHDFECIHSYIYYDKFYPTIAEVLAQIPQDLINHAVAFEIIECPETEADFKRNLNAFNQGFHSSTVRLYFPREN